MKAKALEHYSNMKSYARLRPSNEDRNRDKMRIAIGENWLGIYCSYCAKFKLCRSLVEGIEIRCPLKPINSVCAGSVDCCQGLWTIMDESKTWHDWIIAADDVEKYIVENG